jgi:oxygen-dependent protoporphyrinogen oxidase
MTLLPLLAGLALASFQGENCASCHSAIRDRSPLQEVIKAEDHGQFDVAVIGGGLSGLTAAHQLRNLKVVVLEKEDHAGGKTWRGSLGAWKHPTGAVYTIEPYGKIIPFFKELGLAPIKFRNPVHNLWRKDGILTEWLSKDAITALASDAKTKDCLLRFSAAMHEVHDKGTLTVPVVDSDPATLSKLDNITLHDYLTREFCPKAAELGDWHARDVFGAGAKDYSAALGMMYLSAEATDAYSWPGGLGEIAQRIAARLDQRVRLGAFVEQVIPGADSVRVLYRRGKRSYELRAKAVVMAVPSMVSRRIIKGLSPEKEKALAAVQYSAYVTMAMRFKKPIYKDSFVLWTPGLAFHDLTFGGGERLEKFTAPDSGQVVVAYLPIGTDAGRRKLLAASDEEIKKKVLADLEKVLPGSVKELVESNIVRWGHAMPVMGPGYLTKLQPVLRKPEGRLFFAGVDLEVPAIEGAMYSGFAAAEGVLAFLRP